jgi:hypothetical protein
MAEDKEREARRKAEEEESASKVKKTGNAVVKKVQAQGAVRKPVVKGRMGRGF